MEHRPAAPEALRELVRAAQVFHHSEPWKQLDSDQPFGVRDPRTNRVVLALVTGQSGIAFGLHTYPAFDGFVTLQLVLRGLLSHPDEASFLSMRSTICQFVKRSDLPPEERRSLRAAGYVERSGEPLPMFRSLVPGFLPWRLDEEEVRLLTLVLEQTIHVARDVALNPKLFDGGSGNSYLTRRSMSDGDDAPDAYEWAGPDFFGPRKRVPIPDELTATRLARLPLREDAEWEIALALNGGVLQPTPGHRPEMLLTMVVVDRASGHVHHGEPLPASSALDDVGARLARTLLDLGYAPRRILVSDPALRAQLAPVARFARSRLLRVQHVARAERARDGLREFLARRG